MEKFTFKKMEIQISNIINNVQTKQILALKGKKVKWERKHTLKSITGNSPREYGKANNKIQ